MSFTIYDGAEYHGNSLYNILIGIVWLPRILLKPAGKKVNYPVFSILCVLKPERHRVPLVQVAL